MAYVAEAVHFDGTNDYLTRGAGLAGAADSKLVTASFWHKAGDDDALHRIFTSATTVGGTTQRFRFFKDADPATGSGPGNNFAFVGVNAAGFVIFSIYAAGVITAASGWHHVLMSIDLSDTGKRHLYVDDVSDLNIAAYTNDTVDFTLADWAIGARPDGNLPINADIADLWVAFGVYIDFSVEANRRKFISAGGHAVDLGADGSVPTGVAPTVFMSGATADWHTNKGSGGGYTENGELTTASTRPPGTFETEASAGTFVLSGIASLFNRTTSIIADVVSFVLSGIEVNLGFSQVKELFADAGAFVVTGVSSAFRLMMPVLASAYSLTGIAAGLALFRGIVADAGAFVVSGAEAFLSFFRIAFPLPKPRVRDAVVKLRKIRALKPFLFR